MYQRWPPQLLLHQVIKTSNGKIMTKRGPTYSESSLSNSQKKLPKKYSERLNVQCFILFILNRWKQKNYIPTVSRSNSKDSASFENVQISRHVGYTSSNSNNNTTKDKEKYNKQREGRCAYTNIQYWQSKFWSLPLQT